MAVRVGAANGPRSVLAIACAVFVLLTWPDPVSVGGLVALGALAAAVWTVLSPGGLGPLVLVGLGVLVWLIAVPDPGVARAVAFGVAGYTVHAVAALAAVIPAGVWLDAATWRAAAVRGAVAVGVSVLAVAIADRLAGAAASSLLIGAALVLAAAVVTLPRMVARWSSR
ncbi:MAG: hypothetical protein H0T85_05770 [Geodermatophilaceae bacterium]|nr:hypothetical protein [Geodermatophilaceae bacterium]